MMSYASPTPSEGREIPFVARRGAILVLPYLDPASEPRRKRRAYVLIKSEIYSDLRRKDLRSWAKRVTAALRVLGYADADQQASVRIPGKKFTLRIFGLSITYLVLRDAVGLEHVRICLIEDAPSNPGGPHDDSPSPDDSPASARPIRFRILVNARAWKRLILRDERSRRLFRLLRSKRGGEPEEDAAAAWTHAATQPLPFKQELSMTTTTPMTSPTKGKTTSHAGCSEIDPTDNMGPTSRARPRQVFKDDNSASGALYAKRGAMLFFVSLHPETEVDRMRLRLWILRQLKTPMSNRGDPTTGEIEWADRAKTNSSAQPVLRLNGVNRTPAQAGHDDLLDLVTRIAVLTRLFRGLQTSFCVLPEPEAGMRVRREASSLASKLARLSLDAHTMLAISPSRNSAGVPAWIELIGSRPRLANAQIIDPICAAGITNKADGASVVEGRTAAILVSRKFWASSEVQLDDCDDFLDAEEWVPPDVKLTRIVRPIRPTNDRTKRNTWASPSNSQAGLTPETLH